MAVPGAYCAAIPGPPSTCTNSISDSGSLGAISHTLWSCTDPAEQLALTAGLSDSKALIADGHHRHAACLRLGQEQGGNSTWDRSLALLVDSAATSLQLTAIHRVVPGLEAGKAAAAAAICSSLEPGRCPTFPALYGMFTTPTRPWPPWLHLVAGLPYCFPPSPRTRSGN